MNPKMIYNKVKKKVPTIVGGLVVVAGSAGCKAFTPPEPRSSTRDDFDRQIGLVLLATPVEGDENRTYFANTWDRYIKDVDGDGLADAITWGDDADWIAEGYQGTNGVYKVSGFHIYTSRAKVMTPEIRAAATRALNGDQDLSHLIAQENHRLYQEEKQGGSQ